MEVAVLKMGKSKHPRRNETSEEKYQDIELVLRMHITTEPLQNA